MKNRASFSYVLVAATVGVTGLPVLEASAAVEHAGSDVSFVLDFEGLGRQVGSDSNLLDDDLLERVADFYRGGLGGNGSGPGIDFGVEFSDNALAIVDEDVEQVPGLPEFGGNFGGEPTPDTALFFLEGDAATVTRRDGFVNGFSFYYAAINQPGFIRVYSGPEGTGEVLASLDLPVTERNGAPDPQGEFSPFVPIGVTFDGIAQSIDFGGTIDEIGFDNITFGSATPLTDNSTPLPIDPVDPIVPIDPVDPTPPTPPSAVPSPAALPAGLLLMAGLGLRRRR